MRLYTQSVLVTSLDDELITLMRHYRDRADCESTTLVLSLAMSAQAAIQQT